MISRVNAYTSKAIAYRDDDPQGLPAGLAVTWSELDAALDAVGSIYKKYYRLRHAGESLGILTPLKSPGWIQMFETAWMPPGFTLLRSQLRAGQRAVRICPLRWRFSLAATKTWPR